MKLWIAGPIAGLVAGLSLSAPAAAEVVAVSDAGFVVRVSAEVTASSQDAWKELVTPADWWLKEHTWSGDPANLYIDSQATGCFCEKLPGPKDMRPGSVQHMQIVMVDPGKVLRMSGALGPLQSEALTGTLTIALKPVDGHTRILWEYVVGGYMRYKPDEIAALVDKVLAGQLDSLAAKLGPVATPVAPAKGQAPAKGAAPAKSKAGMAKPAPAKKPVPQPVEATDVPPTDQPEPEAVETPPVNPQAEPAAEAKPAPVKPARGAPRKPKPDDEYVEPTR